MTGLFFGIPLLLLFVAGEIIGILYLISALKLYRYGKKEKSPLKVRSAKTTLLVSILGQLAWCFLFYTCFAWFDLDLFGFLLNL